MQGLGVVMRDHLSVLYRAKYQRLRDVYPLAPEPDELLSSDAETFSLLCDAALQSNERELATYLWMAETNAE